jgi:hypothetical protein
MITHSRFSGNWLSTHWCRRNKALKSFFLESLWTNVVHRLHHWLVLVLYSEPPPSILKPKITFICLLPRLSLDLAIFTQCTRTDEAHCNLEVLVPRTWGSRYNLLETMINGYTHIMKEEWLREKVICKIKLLALFMNMSFIYTTHMWRYLDLFNFTRTNTINN